MSEGEIGVLLLRCLAQVGDAMFVEEEVSVGVQAVEVGADVCGVAAEHDVGFGEIDVQHARGVVGVA